MASCGTASGGHTLGEDIAAQYRHMRHRAQQVRQGGEDAFARRGHRLSPGLCRGARRQPAMTVCPFRHGQVRVWPDAARPGAQQVFRAVEPRNIILQDPF